VSTGKQNANASGFECRHRGIIGLFIERPVVTALVGAVRLAELGDHVMQLAGVHRRVKAAR